MLSTHDGMAGFTPRYVLSQCTGSNHTLGSHTNDGFGTKTALTSYLPWKILECFSNWCVDRDTRLMANAIITTPAAIRATNNPRYLVHPDRCAAESVKQKKGGCIIIRI